MKIASQTSTTLSRKGTRALASAKIGRAVQQECRYLPSFPTRRSSDLRRVELRHVEEQTQDDEDRQPDQHHLEPEGHPGTGERQDRKSGSAGMPIPTLFPYTTLFRSTACRTSPRRRTDPRR